MTCMTTFSVDNNRRNAAYNDDDNNNNNNDIDMINRQQRTRSPPHPPSSSPPPSTHPLLLPDASSAVAAAVTVAAAAASFSSSHGPQSSVNPRSRPPSAPPSHSASSFCPCTNVPPKTGTCHMPPPPPNTGFFYETSNLVDGTCYQPLNTNTIFESGYTGDAYCQSTKTGYQTVNAAYQFGPNAAGAFYEPLTSKRRRLSSDRSSGVGQTTTTTTTETTPTRTPPVVREGKTRPRSRSPPPPPPPPSPPPPPMVPPLQQDFHAASSAPTGWGSHRPPSESRRGRRRRGAEGCGCQRVRINVSGHYFEARVGLLNKHPDTLLGDRQKRQKYYDRSKDELFFDRHRPSFEAIFSYYQYGGKLKRPHHVPDDIFLSELQFYELEKDVVEEYKRQEGYTTEEVELPSNACLRRLWILFEYPETSTAAFLVAIVSVIMTLVSIVLFCIETLPLFSQSHCVTDEAPNFLDPFFVIETTCTSWFTIEVIVRFIASPNKLRFWKDFKNLVDVTAVVPYYITLINVVSTMSCASAKSSASLAFLRVIRLIRVFKLTKHSVGLQVLILTFKASVEGLGLFLVALVVCLLVYSSAIYYAELGIKDSQISSIPDAFWWAIITMTTVGYGDKVPVGVWGKLIGAACAITGVLTLAIPVPIITGHFNRFYSHKTGRGRHV